MKLTKKNKLVLAVLSAILIIGSAYILVTPLPDKYFDCKIGMQVVKSETYKLLERGLLVLIVTLILISIFVGYMRLTAAGHKRYLRYVGQDKSEYHFKCQDNDYYISKEAFKNEKW